MIRLLVLLLVACGPARPPTYGPCFVNDVACSDGEVFQCVCALQTCSSSSIHEGEWKRLGDSCLP